MVKIEIELGIFFFDITIQFYVLFLERERVRGFKKMRHRWEREKDRKRGMVGERKIGREKERQG